MTIQVEGGGPMRRPLMLVKQRDQALALAAQAVLA